MVVESETAVELVVAADLVTVVEFAVEPDAVEFAVDVSLGLQRHQ